MAKKITYENHDDTEQFQRLAVVLKPQDKSVVRKVYTIKKRGKWIISEQPIPGATIEYYATKTRDRLYYPTRQEAQARADQYNKRRAAQILGKAPKIPSRIDWHDFDGTELQDERIWWPRPRKFRIRAGRVNNNSRLSPWLYAHGYDDWDVDELLNTDVTREYADFFHSTADFFQLWGRAQGVDLILHKTKRGEWVLRFNY